MSDAGSLMKEQLDTLTRGSGFSFGDLAANRAGVRFAFAATKSDSAARAMQARLHRGFSSKDFSLWMSTFLRISQSRILNAILEEWATIGTTRWPAKSRRASTVVARSLQTDVR